jgi:hypothetical protein
MDGFGSHTFKMAALSKDKPIVVGPRSAARGASGGR